MHPTAETREYTAIPSSWARFFIARGLMILLAAAALGVPAWIQGAPSFFVVLGLLTCFIIPVVLGALFGALELKHYRLTITRYADGSAAIEERASRTIRLHLLPEAICKDLEAIGYDPSIRVGRKTYFGKLLSSTQRAEIVTWLNEGKDIYTRKGNILIH